METRSKKVDEDKDLQNSVIVVTISNILSEIIAENKESSKKLQGIFST
jgi:hypothetical protein